MSVGLGWGEVGGIAAGVLALVLLLLAWRVYRRAFPLLPPPLRPLLLALRGVSYVLLALLVLSPVVEIRPGPGGPRRVAVLADGSVSMLLPAAGAAGEGPSRWERLQALLDEGPLARALGGQEAHLFLFGPDLRPWERDAGGPPALRGPSTDLGGALRALGERSRQWDLVVVVSDGRITAGEDPARALRSQGIPARVVAIGEPLRAPDLVCVRLRAPAVAYEGTSIPLEVAVRGIEFAGGDVEVTLLREEEVVGSVRARLDPGDSYRDFTATLDPLPVGWHRLAARIAPLPGEFTQENNERVLYLQVLPTRRKALLLTDGPSWDLEVVRRALEEDGRLAVTTWARVQAKGEFIAIDPQGEWSRLPRSQARELLASADAVVVHGDVGALWDLLQGGLEGIARDPRKGLLFLLARAPGGQTAARLPAGLLPLRPGLSLVLREGDHWAEPAPAVLHPALQGAEGPAGGPRSWSTLPPLPAVLAGGVPAPGASVLLYGGPDPGGNREGPRFPLLVVSAPPGVARRACFLGQGIWRWTLGAAGRGASGGIGGRLWPELLAWLLGGEGSEGLTVEPVGRAVERGTPVRFRGRSGEGAPSGAQGEGRSRAEVVIRSGGATGTEVARVALRDVQPGLLAGEGPILPPGDYWYEAQGEGGERGAEGARGRFTVERFSQDLADPRPDPDLLRALAQAGGQAAPVTGGEGPLSLDLEKVPAGSREGWRWELWRNPVPYLVLLGLLGTEWFIRRSRGLP